MKVWRAQLALICMLLSSLPSYAAYQHDVYFAQTDYRLDVYRIRGDRPGKTLLLIGGIQGDEPGGYLSADRYVDLALEKGNLIIVPRANMKAVMLGQRGPDGDMNRQFHEQLTAGPMQPVVRKLQGLIAEADVFLNLHEGWGYYRPTYIDDQRNPKRYGQSLIVDAEAYRCAEGRELQLGKVGRQILQAVNRQIDRSEHHLHFFNTVTEQPDTPYKAMRKTATYYALRQHCVPAYGVEVSKNLHSLALKIKYQQLVINQFMHYLDIVPRIPALTALAAPDWVMVQVLVDGVVHYVRDGDRLVLPAGAQVEIREILGDNARGYTADVRGVGGLQDQQRVLRVRQDTELILRKEQEIFGRVGLVVSSDELAPPYFLLEKNGRPVVVGHNQSIELAAQDRLVIRASYGYTQPVAAINFKGWVPPTTYNRGDDRHYLIRGTDRLQKKYSLHGQGKKYPVVAEDKRDRVLARMWVSMR